MHVATQGRYSIGLGVKARQGPPETSGLRGEKKGRTKQLGPCSWVVSPNPKPIP
ncbi:unnamed protein product [Discosporangium mesarthrocarpum]